MAVKIGKKKVEVASAKAKTFKDHPDGTKEETVEAPPVEPQGFESPPAQVHVHADRRQTDGNYGSYAVGCSLTLPCDNNSEAIEEAYQTCQKWVDAKMDDLLGEEG